MGAWGMFDDSPMSFVATVYICTVHMNHVHLYLKVTANIIFCNQSTRFQSTPLFFYSFQYVVVFLSLNTNLPLVLPHPPIVLQPLHPRVSINTNVVVTNCSFNTPTTFHVKPAE